MQWFFARRYLFSRSSHSVINIIAGVSLVSVAIPVAAMVILLSVFNGFESLIKRMYATTDADIEISRIAEPTEQLRQHILATEGVESASFVIEGQALARFEKRETAVTVRGVDENYFAVLPINQEVMQGSAELTIGDYDRALLTRDVAQLLTIYTVADSNISLHAISGSNIGSLLPLSGIKSQRIAVGGVMRGSQQLKGLIIVPLRTAAKLFSADKIKLYLHCSEDIEKVKERLQSTITGDVKITTRAEKNAAFYQIMRYEKWAVFFVALLVLLIASLSIIGTVIMLIVEKRDQQQTLLSIGADRGFIRGIFVREGLLISGIGGAAGLIIGVVVVLVQQIFGIITLPSANFIVDSYPVELHISDIIIVFITFVAVAFSGSQIAANTMIKR